MLSHDLGNTNITVVRKEIFSGLHICIELTKNGIHSNPDAKGLTQIRRVAFISYKVRLGVGVMRIEL